MQIIISNSSPKPIYEQIKDAITSQIMNGELKEGESLPSIRNLASDIRISIMTIKKAYDELELEGYITSRQGKGTFVASKNKDLIREVARKDIEKNILDIIELSEKYDISKQEIIDLFNYLYGSEENE